MDISTLIDSLLKQVEVSTAKFSISYNKEISKILTKSNYNLKKIKKNLTDNNKISTAKKLYLVDINKKSLQLAESLIDSFAKKHNIARGQILFASDLKTINSTLIDGIDAQLEQIILNQMTSLQFTASSADIAKTISNQIGKSVRQTELLLQEALTLANRNISNLIYKNIENNISKISDETLYYEYAGVKDSKNSEICAQLVGEVKTRAQWNSLGISFVHMGHYGCRHSMELAEKTERG